jgi:hypothetical protein
MGVVKIFDSDTDTDEFRDFGDLQTTYEGGYVYFQAWTGNQYGSLWHIDEQGLNLIKIIEPSEIMYNWGKGGGLASYAISDNAGKIAFILRGYWENEYSFIYRTALWLKTGPQSYKMLDGAENTYISTGWLDISGDGKVILYHKRNSSQEMCYYVINDQGTSQVELAQIDIPGNKDMDYYGSRVFTRDSRSYGRLAATDLSHKLDVMPFSYWSGEVTLSYNDKVCVVTQGVGIAGIYIGYLNTGAPVATPIKEIKFDPHAFPINDPSAKIKLLVEMKYGAEVDYTNVEILFNGENKANGYSSSQVWFPRAPNDNGTYEDEIAGDNIYTTYGEATPLFEDSDTYKNQVYTRVIARSTDKVYQISDVLLKIEYLVDVEDNINEIPEKFSLDQNYPNPFNPSTTIKYSIPKQSNVALKVFDVLGSEVATLVNKEQSQGNYEVEFDGSDLTSGIYFYRLQAGDYVQTKKMILLK